MKTCIESVHQTMSECRGRMRNRAMLRNLTALVPVTDCKTRWSGKFLMLDRFNRIYDELRAIAEDEESNLTMNLTSDFQSTVRRIEKQLRQVDLVSKYLQQKTYLYLVAGLLLISSYRLCP